MAPPQGEPIDRSRLVDLLEAYFLGEEPALTGQEIADDVGITFEEARRRWRSLGFTEVGADVPAFTHADLEALRLTQRLLEIGLIDASDESALVRTLGRSFARLAEWQVGLLANVLDMGSMDLEEMGQVMDEVTPAVERLQTYVWRRHMIAAASRLLLADADQEAEEQLETGEIGTLLGVGFADIVGFTRESRRLTRRELARHVDHFEERALEIVVGHEGRIIKTIGDEVLFVADTPGALAQIGLELAEEHLRDDGFPEVRVGMSWGLAVARFGDVLGPTVNVASRLTSTARPGRVLVDRVLADCLQGDEHVKLRRLRRTTVRGYRRLEPWLLRRPTDEDPEITHDGEMPGPASAFLQQQIKDIRRAIDEMDTGAEDAVDPEGTD